MPVFREMKEEDREQVYQTEYKEWGDDYPFFAFSRECKEEENFGTRFVLLNENNAVVSSLISYPYNHPSNASCYIVGSVITSPDFRENGYGSTLIKRYLSYMDEKQPNSIFFLYSDILPSFYRKLGFKELPDSHQKVFHSTCMVHCTRKQYGEIISYDKSSIPEYYFLSSL